MNLEASTATADIVSDRRFKWIGFTIVIVVFFGFGSWAALAPLSSAAHAPGKIRVESQRKSIQHLEGGIVKVLPVKDGQRVEKGQVLMILDDTQPDAELEMIKGQYFLTLAREARLTAQRDELDEVVYPEELSALVDDPRIRQTLESQNKLFRTRNDAYENEIALYKEQAVQLEAQLKGLEAQRSAARRLVRSYSAELKDMQALQAKGYAERRQVRELERQLAENEGELGDFVARMGETKSEIIEAKLQVLQLQREFQREVATDLERVQEQRFQFIEQKQALEDTLARTVIRSPQSGTVLDLAVHTIGAVITRGDVLMDIVPQEERLIVEARISPVDIDRVAIGQLADVRFSAFKMRQAPRVDGKLINVSADSLVDPADQAQTPYYLAIVEITTDGLSHLEEKGLKLVAGMPADVFIKTGDRTLLRYFIDPLKDTVARAFIED